MLTKQQHNNSTYDMCMQYITQWNSLQAYVQFCIQSPDADGGANEYEDVSLEATDAIEHEPNDTPAPNDTSIIPGCIPQSVPRASVLFLALCPGFPVATLIVVLCNC